MRKKLWIGVLGALLMAISDWLMIYGDPTPLADVSWLTVGVANMSLSRLNFAMALAFPAIIFYGIALVGMKDFIIDEPSQQRYKSLLLYSMMPWLLIHFFVVVILYVFAFMSQGGYVEAIIVAQAIYNSFSWMVFVGEAIMVLPFLYWIILLWSKRTIFSQAMILCHVGVFYLIFSIIRNLLPLSAFRLAFGNGLMSESMMCMFLCMIVYLRKKA